MNIHRHFLGGVSAAFLAIWPVHAQAQSVTIAGPEILTEIFIPTTLEAFARDLGLNIRREVSGDGAFSLLLSDGSGQGANVRFDIRVAESSTAITQFALGEVDVAVTTRAPKEAELAALGSARAVSLGRDAMVGVVASNNPVHHITLAQLAGVVSGEITNWADLGGPEAAIRLHLLEDGTDQDTLMRDAFFGEAVRRSDVTLHLSASGVSDAVSADPTALGLSTYSEMGNARALGLAGPCGLAVRPDRLAIKNADYPLATPLTMYYRASGLSQMTLNFLRYIESDAVQGPIRQAGFIDGTPESVTLTDQGQRLANAIRVAGRASPTSELRRLVETLEGSERLSVTFRFQPKSSELDTPSQALIASFAEELERGDFDGRKVTLVGFTDGVGTAEQNLAVGRSRARATEAALREAAPGLDAEKVELTSNAFGEAMPIACDDTDWGRDVNRRVELWVD